MCGSGRDSRTLGLRVPLQLQMLEADFLDQARTMGLVNGHVMEGVQFDEMGRRVAYWLFSYHPGGVLILNPRGGIVSQPVPAEQIMHVYRVLRPGQVRGVPWLAPVMMALRDLDDYCDAERVRKKVEACVTAFVEQPEGIDGDPLGIAGTDPSSGLPVESFQPGMVEYLKPGQEVKFNNPPAAGGYREYKMTELQGIMAGIGLPYELGTGDMSQVNYSSWRGGMLGFRNTVEAYRWLTLIPLFCMPVWRRFIDTLILQGKIPQSAANDPKISLRTVQWTAPRFESVDPVKDAEAVLKDVRMGRKTWFEAVLENGYDPTTQLEQIALFNKLLDKFEIILDSRPAQHHAARPGAAGEHGRAHAERARPLPARREPGLTALSEEDLGMVKDLLAAGMSQRGRQLGIHLPPLSELIANTHTTNRRTVYERKSASTTPRSSPPTRRCCPARPTPRTAPSTWSGTAGPPSPGSTAPPANLTCSNWTCRAAASTA